MTSLSDILLQETIFLATASDAEIHPDVAVAQLEALGFALRGIPEAERADFAVKLRERMSHASGRELDALRERWDMLGD